MGSLSRWNRGGFWALKFSHLNGIHIIPCMDRILHVEFQRITLIVHNSYQYIERYHSAQKWASYELWDVRAHNLFSHASWIPEICSSYLRLFNRHKYTLPFKCLQLHCVKWFQFAWKLVCIMLYSCISLACCLMAIYIFNISAFGEMAASINILKI